ncbi:hypothetical protein C8Q75DRAFT_803965 [Abortiporus biennis]|nr:hypothetical protein C8Q75DRAFT_803965 [Abortiporus biennis]
MEQSLGPYLDHNSRRTKYSLPDAAYPYHGVAQGPPAPSMMGMSSQTGYGSVNEFDLSSSHGGYGTGSGCDPSLRQGVSPTMQHLHPRRRDRDTHRAVTSVTMTGKQHPLYPCVTSWPFLSQLYVGDIAPDAQRLQDIKASIPYYTSSCSLHSCFKYDHYTVILFNNSALTASYTVDYFIRWMSSTFRNEKVDPVEILPCQSTDTPIAHASKLHLVMKDSGSEAYTAYSAIAMSFCPIVVVCPDKRIGAIPKSVEEAKAYLRDVLRVDSQRR